MKPVDLIASVLASLFIAAVAGAIVWLADAPTWGVVAVGVVVYAVAVGHVRIDAEAKR